MELTTDDFPGEVSWDVVDTCSGETVATGESYSSSGPMSLVSTAKIGQSSFAFTIRDSAGDGMSSPGKFLVTYNDVPTLDVEGDSYEKAFTAQFGVKQCK